MESVFDNMWTSAKILFYTALFLSIEVIFIDRVVNQFSPVKILITEYSGVGGVLTAFIAWFLLIVAIMRKYRDYHKLAATLLNIVTIIWIIVCFGKDMIEALIGSGSNESLLRFSLNLIMSYVYYLATRLAYKATPQPNDEDYY